MGDVGSALLGCLLATLPLLGGRQRSLWPAVILVWPFVFDTTVTLFRRARRGEALMSPHRTHLYQRLTQAGWPHARTAMLYGALALAGALVAVPMATGVATSPVSGLTLLAVGTTLLWMLTGRVERRGRAAAGDRRNTHA